MRNSIQLSGIGFILLVGLLSYTGAIRSLVILTRLTVESLATVSTSKKRPCVSAKLGTKSEDRCDVKQVTKFVGSWQASDVRVVNGLPDSITYQVEIQESPSSITTIFIDNFANLRLEDYDGNLLCEPRPVAVVGGLNLNIEDQGNGVSYCDAQRTSLDFSGYRFSNALGSIDSSRDTLRVDYELTYTLNDEQGTPVTTTIVSSTSLTRL